MTRTQLFILLAVLAGGLLFLAIYPSGAVYALPEYSAQTGEPCSSCHLSPSGGGARGARGQAWVGSEKPGIVPDLAASLEILGVHLEVDETLYTVVPENIPASPPMPLNPQKAAGLRVWLQEYQGN